MSDKGRLLTDLVGVFRPTVLEESKSGLAKYIARGEFARSDRATENKRLYTHALWEREISRLDKSMKENKVYGELDHPGDGRTQLKRASHFINNLHMEGAVVVGEAHIMDTDAGRNLKAILDAGGAVGVSSRGFGTTKANFKGEDVVQNDYRLMTFDFVAEPAMSSAYPVISTEDADRMNTNSFESVMEENMTFEEMKEKHPELFESFMHDAEREWDIKGAEIWAKKLSGAKDEVTNDLRGEFAQKLEDAIKNAREEMEASIRERLMNDPAVAGAKKALGELKEVLRPFIIPEDVESVVVGKEDEISELRTSLVEAQLVNKNLIEENDKLAAYAKEAAYRFHLEETLRGCDEHELVRSLVGDVKQYGDVQAINEKVGSVLEEVSKQRLVEDARDEEVSRLQEETDRHRLAAEKALEATKELAIQVYIEKRLANHPDADMARMVLESKAPSTKEEVDILIESTIKRSSATEDLDAVRARVRNITNSQTVEYLQEEQVNPVRGVSGSNNDWNGLGTELSEIRALSGYTNSGPDGN